MAVSETSSSAENQNLSQALKRINLVTGKGGVGKTSLSVVLAKTAAAHGKKTLIAEIEDDSGWASPLGRCFGMKRFEATPKLIQENLYGLKLSAVEGQEQFLNSYLKIRTLTHLVLSNPGIRWFLDGAPAFKEMGYFYHLLMQLRADYDCIILDLPATGHFVGLARLPKLLLKLIPFGPIADRLKEGQSYFYDPAQTAAWVVTLPQVLPVSESIELIEAAAQESIPIGGVVMNRCPLDPFDETEFAILNELKPGTLVNLERIRRFREAGARLRESTDVPIWLAPESLELPDQEVGFAERIHRL